jgi:uroporphyrinogen decarboxylase
MTSRERILAAAERKEPDKIPVDMGSTPSSGISAIAYGNLKNFLGINQGHIRVYDVVQQLAQPEECIIENYGIDVLDIGRTFNAGNRDWYDIILAEGQKAQYPAWFRPEKQKDGSFIAYTKDGTDIAFMPSSGTFFDQRYFPWIEGYPENIKSSLPAAMEKVLWAALVHSPWDHAGEKGFWELLRKRTLALRKKSDKALVVVAGCNLFEWGTFLRRMDNFLMDLFLEQKKVQELLESLMEVHINTLEKICTYLGDICDILRFGDDLGMDSGPFIPPRLYKTLFKPHHTRLCQYVHKNSRMKTFLHSCGSIYKLMPDLIDAGYDIINPVQTNCKDMQPRRLKREFGRDITFWGGGCDTREILNKATPREVEKHVLERLEIFSPQGGFVFNTVHNILPEVPPENIQAMFQALAKFNNN